MQIRLLLSLMLIVMLNACTDEPDLIQFSVSIKNSTDKTFEIRCFSQGKLQVQKSLSQGEAKNICTYTSEFFIGLAGCQKDSVVVEFNNSKGYIDIRLGNNLNEYRFLDNKSIFIQGNGFQNVGNEYEFSITQQDFENAFELPK
ncbi:hypothetical protein F8C76_15355 [Flagellimonas olearia]|uniref:Lipoprotein n=2 Tax=Flagellimonas olearia TaxID=552546 RepID=A0A6I1E0R2_9FLAO|nr:hypothetical protein [Allomuricauda olearia]KAB7529207.1 hypothetical protein F8C76_15355 [Allomuricauda olearia]